MKDRPRLRDLMRATCELLDTTRNALLSNTRRRHAVMCRTAFVYAALKSGHPKHRIAEFLTRENDAIGTMERVVTNKLQPYAHDVRQWMPEIIHLALRHFRCWIAECKRPAHQFLRDRAEALAKFDLPLVRVGVRKPEPPKRPQGRQPEPVDLDEFDAQNRAFWRRQDEQFSRAMQQALAMEKTDREAA